MTTYLAKNPVQLFVLMLIGAGLLIVSALLVSLNPNAVTRTSAAVTCDSSYPTTSGADTYKTTWSVTKWLAYEQTAGNTMPVGPHTWSIKGRINQTGKPETCFNETWTLKRIVYASSRNGRRGIHATQDGANNTATFANWDLSIVTPGIGAAGNGNFQDPTFKYNENWDQVGLYGLLKDNKDDLKDSHSYFPVEWEVSGQF